MKPVNNQASHTPATSQPLLTIKEVAARLNVKPRTLRQWVADNTRWDLPIEYLPTGGIRFEAAAIEVWRKRTDLPLKVQKETYGKALENPSS